MWQITLDEIMNTAFVPNGNYEWRKGIWTYFCPLCGSAVGMFSDGTCIGRQTPNNWATRDFPHCNFDKVINNLIKL